MKIVAGIFCGLIALASLWVGAYVVHLWGDNDWQQFPAMMTTLVFGMSGLSGALWFFSEYLP